MVDSAIQNGQLVFTGTRVSVQILLCHLEKGITLEEFLEDFLVLRKNRQLACWKLRIKLYHLRNCLKSMKLLVDENLPKRIKSYPH